MAIRKAVANGNASATTTWDGGTLPTSSDDVSTNNCVVTVDADVAYRSITNAAGSGITAGGYFTLLAGKTLTAGTATVGAAPSGNRGLVNYEQISGVGYFVGNIVAGGGSSYYGAVSNTAGGRLEITGNVSTTTGNTAYGVYSISGDIKVTGTVTGGTAASQTCYGAYVTNGNLIIIGACQAGAQSAISSSNGASGNIYLSGPFLCAADSTQAVNAQRWKWIASPSGTFMEIYTDTLDAKRNLYTADYTSVLHMPAIANVRDGTVYGPSSELTGTCKVPPAASVGVGVPVDATVGTAALDASTIGMAILNTSRTASFDAGSVGERLKNVATIDSTGTQIAAAVGAA